MQILRDPEPDVALDFLRSAIRGLNERKGRLVEIIAECDLVYDGRASSTLPRGERVILLKPDGTFLVHAAKKAKPVNWQPPGASFHADLRDDRLVLTAHRTKPEELVVVNFHNIRLLLSVPLNDGAELALVGSEADLQQLLFEHPHLVEDGFVPRRRERDSKRGFYDLDGQCADGRRLVVEVKRATAGVKEAQQLWRYVDKLRSEGDGDQKVRGILIAPRVADKARGLLRDHDLEWKEVDWAELLPKITRMRHGGQVGLSRYG